MDTQNKKETRNLEEVPAKMLYSDFCFAYSPGYFHGIFVNQGSPVLGDPPSRGKKTMLNLIDNDIFLFLFGPRKNNLGCR